MSIMPCYPDKRAIENELGGKWELFFEETRDEAGTVGLEWDKDFDDTPLHLNGVRIAVELGAVPDRNIVMQITVNDLMESFTAYSSGSGRKVQPTFKVNNGMIDHITVTTTGNARMSTNSIGYFADFINYLKISIGYVYVNSTIKVYVLRGV